jgi:hypothetical protein
VAYFYGMKSITSVIILLTLAIACKTKPAKNDTEPTAAADSSGSYMPVAGFIKADILRTDSMAAGILLRSTVNGRKDSAYIQPPQFRQLAQQFLLPELDSASFAQQFTESSLMDETTQLLNFIYTPKQPDNALQKVIVYVKPALTTDKVDRIYMENEVVRGDTVLHQKLTWKLQEYFYVITIREPKTGPAVTSMEKVIWEPSGFAEDQ